MKRTGWILAVLALATLPASALAEDFEGTRPLGMGGAHRAVVNGNDAIELNPAGMSLFKRYSAELQYFYTPTYFSEEGPAEHVFHVAVVDSITQSVAVGLAYTRVERSDSKKPLHKSGNRYDLAFSVPLSESILIGTNIKYLNFDRGDKKDAVDAVSVDVGALIRTEIGLNLGIVGYNLTNPADYSEHPMSMGVAVMYSPFRTLEVAFDWLIDFQKPKDEIGVPGEEETAYSFNFGAEYLLLDQLTFRGGFRIDKTGPAGDAQYWSAGIGYVDPTVALDFGYRGSVQHSWDKTLAFGLRFFM